MLAIDRYRRILELLQENGSLRTMETAQELGVTDETVRKDFEALEKRGDLVRIHGGAGKPERPRDLPFNERQLIRREEKRAIARAAATRIRANETIFLDASSTVLTLTEFLPDLPLTIVTNALNVFTALSDRPNLELICTGGLYDPRSRSFVGLTAEKALQRYHIDRMFFSGNGVDISRGISESQSQQAAFKERVIAYAEDVVLLADHSKLGKKSAFFFASPADLNCLVTDNGSDPEMIQELRNAGIEVVQHC
ncbi:MAG: DeoR/GlpR transcriptional regulator [Verrucomicrobiaceae bacterium]|nr:MAG: DeoR/GlpR transcriptional regulator [Verrucomicrobiaceae bacterium]